MTGTSALAHYLNVLRRSAWLIVLITALCATGATYLSARKEKLYSASSDAFLSSQNLGYALSNVAPAYVGPVREGQTQADLAQTPAVPLLTAPREEFSKKDLMRRIAVTCSASLRFTGSRKIAGEVK